MKNSGRISFSDFFSALLFAIGIAFCIVWFQNFHGYTFNAQNAPNDFPTEWLMTQSPVQESTFPSLENGEDWVVENAPSETETTSPNFKLQLLYYNRLQATQWKAARFSVLTRSADQLRLVRSFIFYPSRKAVEVPPLV